MARILVVERTGAIQALLKKRFPPDRVKLEVVPGLDAGAERLKTHRCHLLIWDATTTRGSYAQDSHWLNECVRAQNDIRVIVVTDDDSDEFPWKIDRPAAFETIGSPADEDEICALVNIVLVQESASSKESQPYTPPVPVEFEGMLGASLPMQEVFQRILEAASADISVLITGETGTGKEMVAAAIHKRSKRSQGPYVTVNTGAMPSELIASELFGHKRGAYTGAHETSRGRFEEADGGTIFLDEISTMDERAQVSLLRVLETKTFRRVGGEKDITMDVRVIAATNENLEQAVKDKRFREDLFYRLEVFHIHVPPLRERPGGVTLLTSHFVPHYNAVYKKTVRRLSPEALRLLRRYSWPGNVRELKNVIQRAVLMAQGEELTVNLLPSRIQNVARTEGLVAAEPSWIQVGMTLDLVEKEFISMTLSSTGGNKKAAALRLGISRRALYNKLRKHGLL